MSAELIQIAWDRVVEAAGSKAVLSGQERIPVERRDDVATALGSLRIEIAKNAEAEAQLQRRVHWFSDHAGFGTDLHKQLVEVVEPLAGITDFRSHEQIAYWKLRSAAANGDEQGKLLGYREDKPLNKKELVDCRIEVFGSSIGSLDRLRDIESALRWLRDRPESNMQIAAAMSTADRLIKLAISEEVEAADALVGIDSMEASGRFDGTGDVAYVESVPLGAVGRLVQLLIVELGSTSSPGNGMVETSGKPTNSTKQQSFKERISKLKETVSLFVRLAPAVVLNAPRSARRTLLESWLRSEIERVGRTLPSRSLTLNEVLEYLHTVDEITKTASAEDSSSPETQPRREEDAPGNPFGLKIDRLGKLTREGFDLPVDLSGKPIMRQSLDIFWSDPDRAFTLTEFARRSDTELGTARQRISELRSYLNPLGLTITNRQYRIAVTSETSDEI